MPRLASIESMDADLVERLKAIGIETSEKFLERGASAEGRDAITEASGVGAMQMLPWLYRADLERVKGIAWDYANLLVAAGVSTVPDLAYRNAEELQARLAATNQEQNLVRRPPTLKQVRDWIEHARTLPAIITFPPNETL